MSLCFFYVCVTSEATHTMMLSIYLYTYIYVYIIVRLPLCGIYDTFAYQCNLTLKVIFNKIILNIEYIIMCKNED